MNQEFLLEVAKEAAEASRIKRHPEYPPVEEDIAGKSIEEALQILDSKYHNVSSVREAVRFIENNGLFEKAESIKDNEEEIAKMMVGAGIYIHDNWIKEHFEENYYNSKREKKKFQFGTSGMIGWDEFSYDLKYVKMAFKKLGLECDDKIVKNAYNKYIFITASEILAFNEDTIAQIKKKFEEVGLHPKNMDEIAKDVQKSLISRYIERQTFENRLREVVFKKDIRTIGNDSEEH